jgi:hypothetical protein
MLVEFDRYLGNHEGDGSWDPFIKSKPDLKMLFANQAQCRLESEQPDQLDGKDRALMRHYCEVPSGATNKPTCNRTIKAARY